MKKSDIQKLSPKECEAKIVEIEKAIIELRGEGRTEKIKPLKKTIAALKMQKA